MSSRNGDHRPRHSLRWRLATHGGTDAFWLVSDGSSILGLTMAASPALGPVPRPGPGSSLLRPTGRRPDRLPALPSPIDAADPARRALRGAARRVTPSPPAGIPSSAPVRVVMGPLDVIRESIFGEASKDELEAADPGDVLQRGVGPALTSTPPRGPTAPPSRTGWPPPPASSAGSPPSTSSTPTT